MKIRCNGLILESVTDGPGCRRVFFMQGCSIQCPSCQNKNMWNEDGGWYVDVNWIADWLFASLHKNVTISGGEPFAQPEALLELTTQLKDKGCHIIVYTGYTFESILGWSDIRILENIDVLVDGPYLPYNDDHNLNYRGSRNQRPIDVQTTLKTGVVNVLDWDNEIIIASNGNIFIPENNNLFDEIGDVLDAKMCGQPQYI